MRIGLFLAYWPWFSLEEQVELSVLADELGLDSVWISEAWGQDAVSVLGHLAGKTERVALGSGLMQIPARQPTATAMAAVSLDVLTHGRFRLGLGVSGPQVSEGWYGVPFRRPLRRTREYVEIVRRALAREAPLEHAGEEWTLPLPDGLGKPLKLLAKPVSERIPIYLGAIGPRAVEQVGEIADGWLPFLFHPEQAHHVWGDALAKGKAKRPEGLGALEVSAGGMVAIGEGAETKALLDFARPFFALYVGGMGARGKNFYNDLACQYGWEKEAKKIQDLYLGGNKRDAEAEVPLEWLEGGNLVGPASYVKERLAAFEEAGITNLQVSPATEDPAATIRQLKEWVL
jgi:F420-dependent oxidoreductase-like protein